MSLKKHYLIYETTNIVNGKNYIGQHITTNLNDGYIGSGKALKHAFKKYGKENFRFEVLMSCRDTTSLNFVEKCLVTKEFIEQTDNYNMREGGGSKGQMSQISKNKMSVSRTGSKNGFWNKTHSPSAIDRMRMKKLGTVQSKECLEKKSKSLRFKQHSTATLPYGIYRHKASNKFQVFGWIDDKKKYLGLAETVEEALAKQGNSKS